MISCLRGVELDVNLFMNERINQSIRNIDAFTLGLGLKVGQDLRGRRKTKKEMRNEMEWNETVRDGMPLYYETREREREEPFLGVSLEVVVVMVVVWRSWLLFFSFLFGSERCDTIERVCARSRE